MTSKPAALTPTAANSAGRDTLPAIHFGDSFNVPIAPAASLSGAINAPAIRLCASVDCRVAVGENPAADAASTLIPAKCPEVIGFVPGEKLSVISVDGSSGTLSITAAKGV